MSQRLPASVIIPSGYRLLKPHVIQRKTDLQLTISNSGNLKGARLGQWEPTTYVGYRADWGDNLTIRPLR